MKAIYLIKYGNAKESFEIREVEKPKAGSGELLIKVSAFGLNYAEVMARQGLYRDAPDLPFIPGYDSVGLVESIGEGVDESWIGKRVMTLSRFGSYAEYVVASILTSAEMPISMSDAEGTAIGVQYTTAYHMAFGLGNISQGEKVLIRAAAGGVGTALIQLCREKQGIIYGLAGSEAKIDTLKKEGIEHAYNYKNTEETRKMFSEVKGGFDVTFNPVAGKTFKQDLKHLAKGGRLFLFGASSRSEKKVGKLADLRLLAQMGFILPIFLVGKCQSVLGINLLRLAERNPSLVGKYMKDLADLYRRGVVKPKIGRIYSAYEIAEAHEFLESGQSMGKIVLTWESV